MKRWPLQLCKCLHQCLWLFDRFWQVNIIAEKIEKKGSKQLTCQVDKKFKLSCMVVLGFAPTSTDCHCVCKWCAFELEPNSSWAKSANIQIAEFAFVPHRFSESIHFHPSYLCKYVILIMPSFLLSMDLFSWILSTFCQCSLPMFATFSVLLCAALPPPQPPIFCSGLKNQQNVLLKKKPSSATGVLSVYRCSVRNGGLVLSKQALAEIIKRWDSQDRSWNI